MHARRNRLEHLGHDEPRVERLAAGRDHVALGADLGALPVGEAEVDHGQRLAVTLQPERVHQRDEPRVVTRTRDGAEAEGTGAVIG